MPNLNEMNSPVRSCLYAASLSFGSKMPKFFTSRGGLTVFSLFLLSLTSSATLEPSVAATTSQFMLIQIQPVILLLSKSPFDPSRHALHQTSEGGGSGTKLLVTVGFCQPTFSTYAHHVYGEQVSCP
ncbi:hypothetical protein ILYODFUR_032490 [Ilyodon furcidens]|uniref:Uncharacterized protein n=1 Tax=Ilyodon furcidens TaxID=33524 RepID=A0ABV0VAJ6_9TELE